MLSQQQQQSQGTSQNTSSSEKQCVSPFRKITVPEGGMRNSPAEIIDARQPIKALSNTKNTRPSFTLEIKKSFHEKKLKSDAAEFNKRVKQISDIIIAARDERKEHNPHLYTLYVNNLNACKIINTNKKLNDSVAQWLDAQDLSQTDMILAGSYLLFQIATRYAEIIIIGVRQGTTPQNLRELTNKITADKNNESLILEENVLRDLFFKWLLYQSPDSREKKLKYSFLYALSTNKKENMVNTNFPVTFTRASKQCCLCSCFFKKKKTHPILPSSAMTKSSKETKEISQLVTVSDPPKLT